MRHFDDELSLFVFLAILKGVLVFPSQRCFTALAINVGNCMKARQKNPFLSRTATDIHYFVEQVSSALATLERLRNKFVVVGQVSPTVNTTVLSVTLRTEIRLKRLHHVVDFRK